MEAGDGHRGWSLTKDREVLDRVNKFLILDRVLNEFPNYATGALEVVGFGGESEMGSNFVTQAIHEQFPMIKEAAVDLMKKAREEARIKALEAVTELKIRLEAAGQD